mmetsp:Transcript_62871/g.182370  ORF Transcript_62871/g.182370 Transcript_62871/m.182370 type:complete len:625 (-) Transcript_62871:133-2007(-)
MEDQLNASIEEGISSSSFWGSKVWSANRREIQSEDYQGILSRTTDAHKALLRSPQPGGGEGPRVHDAIKGDVETGRIGATSPPDDGEGSAGGEVETASTSTGSAASVRERDGFECKGLPWQQQSKRYYVWILPFTVFSFVASLAPAYWIIYRVYMNWTPDTWRTLLEIIPPPLAVFGCFLASAFVAITYIYHFFRFRGSEQVPEILAPNTEPLTHVVIVCSYKEPIEVLMRTFDSIAGQRGLRKPPIAVLAAEARDPTWRSSFDHIERACKDRLGELIFTEHTLLEGEAAGKSANENFAAREVQRLFAVERNIDPFKVMITIVDADSVLSSSYLAHVEAAFYEQPDGRRLLYNGPLNVYRNFAEADLLVQALELMRCHQDTFHGLFTVNYPYSNYSLTLGFASEIGYWTPDVMPEDIHSVNRAMTNSFGSRTTVTIPSFICNDLVETFSDRYKQAKRHQYGSVTELAWTGSLFKNMGLRLVPWWTVFSSEAARPGSFLSTVGCVIAACMEFPVMCWVALHFSLVPSYARFLLGLAGFVAGWSWLWFWVAEFTLWQTLLKQFPIERPSVFRWLLLVLLLPALNMINRIAFLILPTADAMFHAVFVGDLAYVCAPKGGPVARCEDL